MLALYLAAASASEPAPLRTFTDWAVGCDNRRSCQAVGLIPENEAAGMTMVIARAPETDAVPEIRINIREAAATSLAVDGNALPVRMKVIDGVLRIDTRDTLSTIRAIRNGSRLSVLDHNKHTIGSVSLRGLTAALINMDDRQKRVGLLSAIGRPGKIPDSDVEPPPQLPNIVLPPRSAVAPRRLSRSEVAKRYRALECDVPEPLSAESDTLRLDARTTLVIFACQRYAYNNASFALLVDESGAIRDAEFDTSPGIGEGNGNRVVNPSWDRATRRFSVFDKERGLGDCGVEQSYVWDGKRFRLVYEAIMNECRGSTDFIPTWRATVSER